LLMMTGMPICPRLSMEFIDGFPRTDGAIITVVSALLV